MGSSNDKRPFIIKKGNMDRVAMMNCSPIYKGNVQYFKDFETNFMEKKDKIFWYLYNLDVSNFSPQYDKPITEILEDVCHLSKNSI